MRTCANVAHGLGRGGGHEPLPEAGEYVVACQRDGSRVSPKGGDDVLREQVVRCGACARATWGETPGGVRMLVCRRFRSFNHETTSDGFCAWGVSKED